MGRVLLLALCWTCRCGVGYRIQTKVQAAVAAEPDTAEPDTAVLRRLAVNQFSFAWFEGKKWPYFDRDGNQSMLEQVRAATRQSGGSPWYEKWKGHGIKFVNEAGIDSGGLTREWLQLVLQSVLLPEDWQPDGLQCLMMGKCAKTSSPQYLLQALPSGDLIPILGIHHEAVGDGQLRRNVIRQFMISGLDLAKDLKQEADKEGYLRTGLAKAYDLAKSEVSQVAHEGLLRLWTSRARAAVTAAKKEARGEAFLSFWMASAYDAGMGILRPGQLLDEALKRFRFLGEWIARAYVISSFGYSPASFHDIFYESLLKGQVQPPETSGGHYQEADSIPECEWLAAVFGRRSPAELETYGWTSCSEVRDPETRRYVDEGCYKPLYRDEELWEVLFTEWGALAPRDVKASDTVPFDRAKEYTQLQCRRTWEKRFADPVKQMVEGFRTVISAQDFWSQITRASQLKDLVEGSPKIDLFEFEKAVDLRHFNLTDRQVFFETLVALEAKGEGLPALQRPLNKLIRFFTGSFKEPVNGWWKTKVIKMDQEGTTKCAPLRAHTCFFMLDIPENCLKSREVLEEIILESVAVEDFALG